MQLNNLKKASKIKGFRHLEPLIFFIRNPKITQLKFWKQEQNGYHAQDMGYGVGY